MKKRSKERPHGEFFLRGELFQSGNCAYLGEKSLWKGSLIKCDCGSYKYYRIHFPKCFCFLKII